MNDKRCDVPMWQGDVLLITNCTWTQDDLDDSWDTSCGEKYTIMEGTPVENKMAYCPFCGGKIKGRL